MTPPLSRLVALVGLASLVAACGYIVVPPEEGGRAGGPSAGWSGVATAVGPADDGGLRIDLAIRNDTADWSTMAGDSSAVLRGGDGATVDCSNVDVGSGGHRLAPGFQMRGYTGGTKFEPEVVTLGVECDVSEIAPGSMLSIDYTYAVGEFNYYDPDATKTDATMSVPLDTLVPDLAYPVGTPVDGLLQPAEFEVVAINDVTLALTGVGRTGDELNLDWETTNPDEYPSYVHIGNPPVIGSDGIIYGYYESPDIATVPLTPAGGTAEWTTTTAVPADVEGLVILLSVESKKQRLFVNYAVDISGAAE